ncbi:Ig-like domain repeat protein [Piscinibacter sp. HJYY11]|uniref:Ig-like domain repeat protein n=1 Tax=Piscinibacter sp. HJYY11 TaxID=2801333 RepID=UPI00191DF3ED|nr:Ig-like domain repeat protein [Piscinibacter sp. HJYY11]MBL0729589.1 Ig-like domain repeat protein [Piscinibacter sp. HJYY11]
MGKLARGALRAVLPVLAAMPMAMAQEVIPDFHKEPGINPNRSFVNQSFNEHIDPYTGALQLHYVDIHVPGNGGFDLSVNRSYNSVSFDENNPAAHSGIAGLGWTIHFGRVLHKTSTLPCSSSAFRVDTLANPVIELPDGSTQMLVFSGSASPMMYTTQRWKADCASGGGLIVYSPDGTRYDMTHPVAVGSGAGVKYAWYTRSIVDRNNNSATVNYVSGTQRISSVTTSDGRSINFTYHSYGLVNTISAHGATFTYSYREITGVPGSYYLTRVDRPGPDGSSWQYEYFGVRNNIPGGYALNRVTYPEGGYIDYDYGSSTSDYVVFDSTAAATSRATVVKSKRASGGGTWNFSYVPAQSQGSFDRTTVSTPSGTVTYDHYGANYALSGELWRVGLLRRKQLGSIRTEVYTWAPSAAISSQQFKRPGAWQATRLDPAVYAPRLTGRTITQHGTDHNTNFSNFDGYDNPRTISESGPNGGSRTTSLTYFDGASKWIIKQLKDQVVSGGVSITRTFDTNGNLRTVNRDGITTEHWYHPDGNVSQTRFPRNLDHSYSNYHRGIARTETQPEGVSYSREVSDAGNLMSERNGEGKTTSYTYDGLNRVRSINLPRGDDTTINYTSTSKTASRGGLVETTTFDGFGRPRRITLGGIDRNYLHDALGRLTFVSNPNTSSTGTTYGYDILDRVTLVRNADSSEKVITYGGSTKAVRDERSHTTTFGYRAYGDPAQQFLMYVTAPGSVSGASISLGRNGKDLVTSMTQDGIARTFDYYTSGYMEWSTTPETGRTDYGRDAAGNMTTKSVGGQTTVFSYDNQNRLYNIDYPGTTPDVRKGYSRTHKLKSVTSSVASRTFDYDDNDNLSTETLVVDGLSFVIGYGYNGRDQLASMTYPRSNRTVSFAPNTLGRPTQVGSFVTSVSYWPSGQVNTITYGNGATSTYGQHSTRLWPNSFVTTRHGTYTNSSYSYDTAGNLTGISDSADSSFNRSPIGYDAINRLTTITGPWGSGTIGYNGRGNITSQTLGTYSLSYGYDGNNRLASISGSRSATYGYDTLGNITSGGGNTYSFDGAPNMRCANCAGTTRVDYAYDGMSQRVFSIKGGVKTYEVYGSHGHLLVEYVASPTPKLTEYFYLGGKRIAEVDPRTVTTTGMTASPALLNPGQPTTLSATVQGSAPTGTVTFREGGAVLGTATVSGGTATLAGQTFSTGGNHNLTAVYSGDANNGPSSSGVVAVAVAGTFVYANPTTALVGQQVYLAATVYGNNPSGNVVFRDNGAVIATVPIGATGTSALATTMASFSTAGAHSITAAYSGDGSNQPTTSQPVVIQVSVDGSVGLTATPTSGSKATVFEFRATGFGSVSTGSVTFTATGVSNGTLNLGTYPLTNGQATRFYAFPFDDDWTVTARHSGNVTSPPVVVTVVSRTGTNPPNCTVDPRLCQ